LDFIRTSATERMRRRKKYLTANAGVAEVAVLLPQDSISFAVIVIGTQGLSMSTRDILTTFRQLIGSIFQEKICARRLQSSHAVAMTHTFSFKLQKK
jgi:hypothetical protein